MTDTQLYLAIGVPVIMNATMLLVTNARITDLRDAINRIGDRLDALTGAVNELDKRLTRVEIKLGLQL